MMRKKISLIIMCALICTWVSTLLALPTPNKSVPNGYKEETKVVLIDTVKIDSTNVIDSIKNKLIEEAESYILKRHPKVNKKIPALIVENGLEHDIDIMFMMAQGKIETFFGLAGAGRETSRRSLFGVANRRYSSYENAIKDYIAILKKSYLTKGRTESHLMNKYTTTRGGRYATDPNYERCLKKAYCEIDKKTNIKRLQKEYLLEKKKRKL